jgi:hypothetical protein
LLAESREQASDKEAVLEALDAVIISSKKGWAVRTSGLRT